MSKVYGVDLGTAFYQTAAFEKDNTVSYKIIRNAFVELADSDETEAILSQNKWQYIKDDKRYYVIGEDALKVARMLPGKAELRRPMQDGVLNKGEDKKLLVMAEMINSTIGKAPDDKSVVCTCVSSPSVDGAQDSVFHKSRVEAMFQRLGWKTKVIDEAFAIILSENPKMTDTDGKEVPYTGLSISCGGGRLNAVLAYKGMQILGLSKNNCGDWIDSKVAEATDTPISQVISIKEKNLDFENLDINNDVVFALDAYYSIMIENAMKDFSKKFMEVKSQFDAPLEIVIAGGSSMPKGFIKKFEQVISGVELPFKIKKVRHASDPRNSVVKGCLIQAAVFQRKLEKQEDKKEEI